MKKFLRYFCTLLMTVVCMGAWADDTYTIGWGTASGAQSQNFTATQGTVNGILSFTTDKNSSQTNPAYNSNSSELRLYYNSGGDGGSITLTPATGVTITGFKMTTSTSPSVNYFVDGGTATAVSGSGNIYEVTDISATESLKIQNANTSNTQLRIKTIEITYTSVGGGDTPTPTTYTVTYDANGGTGTMTDSDSPYDAESTVTVLGNEFTRDGYTFTNWNTAADGSGTDYDEDDTFTINENTTLYAQWTENGDGNTQTLTFDVSSNPGEWPTANSTTLTNYTYTLADVDYTFGLKNVKCNSGYLMMTQVAVLGLPAIQGYKLTKVVVSNSSGCSTSTKVGISSSDTQANYISGGEIQTWATQSSQYTYNLTSTEANTVYYMYVTNKNAQVTKLALTYEVDNSTPAPSITIADNNVIAYDATSGSFKFTVANPADDGVVTASSNEEWISDVAVSGNTVTFTTTENEATTPREGVITLTYSYDNNSETVTKDVTVTQAGNPNAPGTQNNPYTVAQARAAIDANEGVTGAYVKGIVSQVDQYNSTYSSITYWISDDGTETDQLEVYSGKGINGANFASIDDIQVGDEVVVVGNLKLYSGSIYEFDKNNELVSIVHATNPVIAIVSLETFTYEEELGPSESQAVEITVANATANTVAVSLTDAHEAYEFSTDNVTFASGTSWTLTLDETNKTVLYARLKAGLTASNDYEAKLTVNADGAVEKSVTLRGFVSEVTPASITVSVPSTTVSQDAQTGSWAITTHKATAWEIFYCPAEAEGQDAVVTYQLNNGQSYYPWVTITLNDDKDSINYTIAANDGEERTVYFRVYGTDNGNSNEVWSKLIKITQHAYVNDAASLPFEFNDGRSAIDGTDGLTHSGLGTDYTGSNATDTKLKFDGTGDYLQLKVNEAIDTLSFHIKGNGFSGGTFKVQTSVDGMTYTDLATYTELGDTQEEKFGDIASAVRYIKWVYTEKSSGNVGLGSISVTKAPEAQPVENVTVTVSAAGLATFASDYDLNFEDVDGLEAYVAVQENNAIKLQEAVYVPAGTGILLHAPEITEATEFTIPVFAYDFDLPEYSDNLFVRGTGNPVASVEGDSYNYVLSNNNNVVGFYRANDKVVGTDKAYLHTTTSAGAGIFFDFSGTTGICTIGQFDNLQFDGAVYDLQGRKVQNPTRGLYIVNGKKVVIK